ncbi:DUF3892 domain-containing protein [Ketobacter sp.]|uniref:DUF3892 domain-containing protein n=1 Tax=Ketobacter sp. TaxID=2083498 RepID=UPI000F13B654|nr:DUF3892 domain-containing protein [Ketobacter sp.]RLU01171.1 MAG: DUF3892 domain-containing protein [Ketobacter sp.]
MTLATNGDYDRTLEISRTLLTTIARETMALSSPPEPLPPRPDLTGTVQAKATLQEIWFRERPQGWAAVSGLGSSSRSTRDMVTFALRLDVVINVQTIQTVLGGQVVTADVTSDPAYRALRTLAFTAFVEIHDHFETQALNVATQRATPANKTNALCLVVDFRESLGTPTPFPRVNVVIPPASVAANPIVQLMQAAAVISNGNGADVLALNQLLADLTSTLMPAVRQQLQTLADWRLDEPGIAIIFAEVTNPNIKRLQAVTLDESLMIGIDELAPRGQSYLMTSSGLNPGQALSVAMANRFFLRGLIRPVLIGVFNPQRSAGGLASSHFVAAEFCALVTPVANVVLPGNRMGTLNSLEAFVDAGSHLRVLLSFDTEVVAGVTLHASLDLQFSFTVQRIVSSTSQALSVTPALANPQTAVLSTSVDLAWYYYLVGALVGELLGLIAAAIVDGIVLELMAKNMMNSAVKGFSGIPGVTAAAAFPVVLTQPRVNLNDGPGTPPQATPRGSLPVLLLLGAGGHDLRVSTGFANLPNPLNVSFQIPDGPDPGKRIDGIGGPLPDQAGEPAGREWALPIDDAIALVEAGHVLQVVVPNAEPARIIVARDKAVPYLRTVADNSAENNLSNLPMRIPAIPATL